MNFIQCCEFIRDVKGDYKVIHPTHLSRSEYSFKFESKGRQRDAFDLIYFHYKTLPPHNSFSLAERIKAVNLDMKTALILINLSSGAWKRMHFIPMREEYETYREIFERITGIEVS